MTTYIKCILVAVLLLIFLIVLAGLEGCGSSLRPSVSPITPSEQWNKTIVQIGWLPTIAIIGCAVSIMAFINGSKSALGTFAGCVVALSLSLATVRFATVIAVVGGIGALAAFVYSVFLKDRALKEVVETVTQTRQCLPPQTDKELFSYEGSFIKQGIQSSATTKLVKKIKVANNKKLRKT